MPSIQIFNQEASTVGDLELSDAVFGAEIKEHLFQELLGTQSEDPDSD